MKRHAVCPAGLTNALLIPVNLKPSLPSMGLKGQRNWFILKLDYTVYIKTTREWERERERQREREKHMIKTGHPSSIIWMDEKQQHW